MPHSIPMPALPFFCYQLAFVAQLSTSIGKQLGGCSHISHMLAENGHLLSHLAHRLLINLHIWTELRMNAEERKRIYSLSCVCVCVFVFNVIASTTKMKFSAFPTNQNMFVAGW